MGYAHRLWPLLLAPLAGCSGLTRTTADTVTATAAVIAPTAPIVSDRFLLDDPAQQVVGELQIIRASAEDTFVKIARTYNLGYDELVEANPDVDPWLPGEGTTVLLPTRFVLPDAVREGVVINIASKRLYYYPPPDADGGRAVMTHPIGIGKLGTETPLGKTTVTAKGRDPVWFPPASIRRDYAAAGNPLPAQVPPGPDNPLGDFVLILGMPSYLIHGTNKPAGVGMRVSYGCVRLFPENIAELFELVPVGTPVTIVNQPYAFAWADGELLLEAHTPLADDKRDWQVELAALLETALLQAAADVPPAVPAEATPDAAKYPVMQTEAVIVADPARIEAIVAAAMGVPLPVTTAAPLPTEVLTAALLVHNLVERPSDAVAPAEPVATGTSESPGEPLAAR